jgi:hypothetical protein
MRILNVLDGAFQPTTLGQVIILFASGVRVRLVHGIILYSL